MSERLISSLCQTMAPASIHRSHCQFHQPITPFTKPCKTPTLNKLHFPSFSAEFYPLVSYGHEKAEYGPSSHSLHSAEKTRRDPSVEPKRSHHRLKKAPFAEKLNEEKQLDPLEKLKKDGDWSKEEFGVVIRSLYLNSRTSEILQVFDSWKNGDKSRINVENYEKIICYMFRDRLTDAAILALEQMKSHGIMPSLEIFNLVINGFARIGQFDDAMFYLNEMKNTDLKPNTEIYNGLIQAFGSFKMYDDMGRCIRKMKLEGCSPDHLTYNLLIREFAKAGLLNKMERTHQALRAHKMDLQTSTVVAMLETYANFGIWDKMENFFRRALRSKAFIEEELVKKLAGVYIENLMFSKLDDLGLDFSSRTGSTDLVWCLRLLSHACNLSKKGMYSIIEEMESKEVPWNANTANIMALALSKMKDFKQLQVLLSELPFRFVKPDIITVGVLFDACMSGFRGTPVKRAWARAGFFDDRVELNTDALVLVAFGKGQFVRDFEELYSFEAKTKRKGPWTYRHLIYLVKNLSNARLVEGEIKCKSST